MEHRVQIVCRRLNFYAYFEPEPFDSLVCLVIPPYLSDDFLTRVTGRNHHHHQDESLQWRVLGRRARSHCPNSIFLPSPDPAHHEHVVLAKNPTLISTVYMSSELLHTFYLLGLLHGVCIVLFWHCAHRVSQSRPAARHTAVRAPGRAR